MLKWANLGNEPPLINIPWPIDIKYQNVSLYINWVCVDKEMVEEGNACLKICKGGVNYSIGVVSS